MLDATLELHPSAALEASTADMADTSLIALRQLMVAQAQACFCEKAEADGLRPSTCLQLFMGASKAFEAAAEAMVRALQAEPPSPALRRGDASLVHCGHFDPI